MSQDLLSRIDERRKRDAKRYHDLDESLCMLCHAYGADMRNLFISCFYDISEVIPEAIDLYDCGQLVKGKGWYLRICKSCRGALMGYLQRWQAEQTALRELPKDCDDGLLEEEATFQFPVRILGATIMMTEEQYKAYRESKQRT